MPGLGAAGRGGAGRRAARRSPGSTPQDAEWRGAHPLNEMRGVEAIAATVWEPLLAAMPDLERRDLIVAGGRYEGRDYVATVGHYCGTFRRRLARHPGDRTAGLPALRRGAPGPRRPDRAVELPLGHPRPDPPGRASGRWRRASGPRACGPGRSPATGCASTRPTRRSRRRASRRRWRCTARSAPIVDRPDAGREELLAMPQREHWHPRMMWYGPAGHRHDARARRLRRRPPAAVPHRLPEPHRAASTTSASATVRFGDRRLAERHRHAPRRRLPGARPDRAAGGDAGDGLLPAPRGADPRELGAARHPATCCCRWTSTSSAGSAPSVAGAADED